MAYSTLNKLEILVIDDERKNRIWFRQNLEDRGFSVIWCQDWNEVDQFISVRERQKEPIADIVLVDMRFNEPFLVLGDNPAMEGVLIIKKFSETCEQYGIETPPIIGFTGREDYIQKREMVKAGVSDFITVEEFCKPEVLGRRLLQCIQEAQEKRMLKPPKDEDIWEIENQIVSRALSLNSNNVSKTANFLHWPVNEVETITRRLQKRGNSNA